MQPDIKAYWLLPDGRIQPVRTSHIQEVINCPEKFGETMDTIRNMYDFHEERMPHEGRARVKIMKRVINRGYIRIREKRNYWVIELFKFSPREAKLISQWVNYIWDDLNDKYSEIKMYTLQNSRLDIMPFREFL